MSGEELFGLILLFAVSSGCGVLFYTIGIWAEKSKKPFGFRTGKEVKPESITDIPGYNLENARMWKCYSAPYFLAAAFSAVSLWIPDGIRISVALLIGACTLGIGWLILRYNRIFREYSVK